MPSVETVEARSALILTFPAESGQRATGIEQHSALAVANASTAAERLPPGQAILLIVTLSAALWAGIAASVLWAVG